MQSEPRTQTAVLSRRALAALAGVALLCALGLEVAVVPTASMENTVLVGDHLLINKLFYGPRIPFTRSRLPQLRRPRVGELVSIRSLWNPELIFLKRVVAAPGDSVQVCGGAMVRYTGLDGPSQGREWVRTGPDGRRTPFPFPDPDSGCKFVTIPANHVFVMGDNRHHSEDSRHWGPVPIENIVGAPIVVLWSYSAPTSAWLDAHGNLQPLIYLSALAHPSRIRWARMGTIF